MQDFKPLNGEEQAIIRQTVDIINRSIAIPCTGCSYCTDGCPMNIAIPKYFSLYNLDMQESREKEWTSQGGYYDNYEGKLPFCPATGSEPPSLSMILRLLSFSPCGKRMLSHPSSAAILN